MNEKVLQRLKVYTFLAAVALLELTILVTTVIVVFFAAPSNAAPSPTPLGGDDISLEEAAGLARNTGFTLERPTALPSDLKHMVVRVTGAGIIDVQQPWIEGLSSAHLIYSKTPIDTNITTLPDLLTSGGIIINERKRDVGFDQSINSTLSQKGEVGVVKTTTVNGNVITSMQTGEVEAVTINGNQGMLITTLKPYFYMNYSELKWGDKQAAITLLAGADHYTKNDLLTIAASFTNATAVNTTTTFTPAAVTPIASANLTTTTITHTTPAIGTSPIYFVPLIIVLATAAIFVLLQRRRTK